MGKLQLVAPTLREVWPSQEVAFTPELDRLDRPSFHHTILHIRPPAEDIVGTTGLLSLRATASTYVYSGTVYVNDIVEITGGRTDRETSEKHSQERTHHMAKVCCHLLLVFLPRFAEIRSVHRCGLSSRSTTSVFYTYSAPATDFSRSCPFGIAKCTHRLVALVQRSHCFWSRSSKKIRSEISWSLGMKISYNISAHQKNSVLRVELNRVSACNVVVQA